MTKPHISKSFDSTQKTFPKVSHRKLLIQHITLLINVRNHVDCFGMKAGISYYNTVMIELQRWVKEEIPECDLFESGYFKYTNIKPANNTDTYRSRLNTTLGGLQGALKQDFPN